MHLDKLEIRGFKSFREKTVLEFPERFTTIVGPNGSGKSNIIDAICFVLGRSRGLRVNNIVELICNGGIDHKPCSEAKVTLYLSDGDKKVTISREVDRSGKSQYRIDDKIASRQEVIEIMGDNEYNILLQGDVTRVIDMKPKERRKIIDDICGIAEYDEKKEKALGELEKVEARIGEIEVILKEKNTHLDALAKEKEDAEKYREYTSDLRKAQATVLSLEVLKHEGERDAVSEKIEKIKKKREENSQRILEIKSEISEKNNRLKEINSEIVSLEERKGATKIIELKKDIQVTLSKQEELKGVVENLKREYAEKKQKEQMLLEEDKRIAGEVKRLAGEIEPLMQKIKEETERISGLDEVDKELEAIRASIVELKSKISVTTEVSARDASEIKRLEDEKTALEEEIKNLLSEEKKLARAVDEATLKNKTLFREYDELRLQQPVVEQRLYEINKALKQVEIEMAKKKAERETLEKTSETVDDVVKAVLKLRDEKMVEGIHGTIAQLGKVSDEKYNTALQVAAGRGRLNTIVVEDEKVAAKCIEYLKKKKIGRATFLPLNKINVKVSESCPDEALGFARDFIDCHKKFEKVFDWVYQDTIVVKDLDVAVKIGINRWRMVTLDGDLTTKEGAMTGGYMASQDLQIRFSSLEEIDKEIKEYDQLRIKLEGDRQENELKKKKIEEKIRQMEESVNAEKTEVEKIRLQKEDLSRRREEAKKRLVEVEERITALKRNIALGEETIKKLSKEIEAGEQKAEKMMKKTPKIDVTVIEELRKEKEEKEIEKNTLEERRRNIADQLKEIAVELGKIEKEQLAAVEGVKACKENLSQMESELKTLEKENEKLIREIEKLIDTRSRLEEGITKLEKEIASLEFGISALNEDVTRLEVEKAKIETRLAEFRKQYEPFIGVETFSSKPLDEVKALVHELEKKISRLGDVNMRAIESYEALKKEIDEVTEKLETLKVERQSIFDFMAEVEKRKTETFMKAFEVVKSSFETIYRELSGGEGTLILDNPRDISESGLLITASPKGKKLMNIDLMSGGEKTVTTSAFLLAIQRYKPSHFYMVDELDAALDRENSIRLAESLAKTTEAQFLLITHNEALMKYAQAVIGISMVNGVSQVVGVKLSSAEAEASPAA